jgi:hypothetical protein
VVRLVMVPWLCMYSRRPKRVGGRQDLATAEHGWLAVSTSGNASLQHAFARAECSIRRLEIVVMCRLDNRLHVRLVT